MSSTRSSTPSRRRCPVDDDHPYRTGAWRPNLREWDADDLEVVEGEIPTDLDGVYLRNTENPVHPSIGMYHPFDGDGMMHQISFAGGRASYRNRFVRTDGFRAEQEAGESLWTGFYDLAAELQAGGRLGRPRPDEGLAPAPTSSCTTAWRSPASGSAATCTSSTR